MAQSRKISKRASGKKVQSAKKATSKAQAAKARTSKSVATKRRTVSNPVAGEVASSDQSKDHPTVTMVRGLAAIVEEHNLCELIVDLPEATLTLRRNPSAPSSNASSAPPAIDGPAVPAVVAQPVAIAPPPAPKPETAAPPPPPPADSDTDKHHIVTSPFVGTFYRRPNPDSAAYVENGSRIQLGQVLCIVEAMKLMNEIEADVAGNIVAVLVEDGEPVEYGQPLFKVAPE